MSSSMKKKFRYLSDPPVTTAPFSIELDENKCIGCALCIKQCPCQVLELVEKKPAKNQQPACQFACPAGIDIRGYMNILTNGGSFEDAWYLTTDRNPMPAITGRICPHPCETTCNRNYLDLPVNINASEQFIGDYGIKAKLAFKKNGKKYSEKIAVVGSGPSGFSCAYQLARLGYPVTIFEANKKFGGMLRYGIPEYRLPEDIIDKELQKVINLGVEVKCNTKIGRDISLADLKNKYKAVYLAIGAHKGKRLGIEGEDASNVYPGIDFLHQIANETKIDLGNKVVVIGGGNAAIDAARVARRLGADVTILYRRTIREMPALASEVEEAQKEGIKIEFLSAPVKIIKNKENKAVSATCIKMELGELDDSGRKEPKPVEGTEYAIEMTSLISAVGQVVDPEGLEELINKDRRVSTNEDCETAERGIFAGGDVTEGRGTVAQAIRLGNIAAESIDAFIRDKKLTRAAPMEISYKDLPLDSSKKSARNETPSLPVEERLSNLAVEVRLTLGQDQVDDEVKRCILCGKDKPDLTGIQYFGKICIACHNCAAICPQQALVFPKYYRVDEGRWTTEFDFPPAGKGFPNPFMEETPPEFDKIAPRVTEAEKLIYTRRSNRVYKKDQVPKELIHRILEAGRFAPSAGNCQPWQFIVIRDREMLDELSAQCRKFLSLVTKLYQRKGPVPKTIKNTLALLMPNSIDQRPMVAIQALLTPKFGEKELDIFFGAPTVILVLANRIGISDPSLNIGICCQNMVLAAHSLGLGTCYVNFAADPVNRNPRLKKKLGMKWPYDRVGTTIAVGYPAVKIDNVVEREFPKVRWIE